MNRALLAGLAVVAVGVAVAAQRPAADPPPMAVGKRYLVLTASEVKRVMEPVEHLPGGWVKCRYAAEKGERLVWLNLAQVVYFEPAPE